MTTLTSLIRWLAAHTMPALRRWASQVLARAVLRRPDGSVVPLNLSERPPLAWLNR